MIEIKFPSYINEISAYVGKLRDLYNYNLNQENSKFKRGDATEYVNILGVKGELIFAHYLHELGLEYTQNKMLDCKPISGYDFIVDGVHVDVKAVRSDSSRLLVNESAHKKSKGIDTYAFIKVINENTAHYWRFDHKEVNEWDLVNAGYSNAYQKKI